MPSFPGVRSIQSHPVHLVCVLVFGVVSVMCICHYMHITRESREQKTFICLHINKLYESYRHVHIFIAENAGYND